MDFEENIGEGGSIDDDGGKVRMVGRMPLDPVADNPLVEPAVGMVWLYHREQAPQGRKFFTDELPDASAGWVDSPAAWVKQRYTAPEPVLKEREQPTECFRYHREHGAVRFWTNALPSEEDGWFDSPTKAAAWQEDAPAAPSLDPKAFDSLDAFMATYVETAVTADMNKKAAAKARKLGVQMYAQARHGMDLDMRKPLDVLAEEVRVREA